jgi:hypothetical protein
MSIRSNQAPCFLRSDGAVDTTLGKGVISPRISPPAQSQSHFVLWSASSLVKAGWESSCFLRDDGGVDRTQGRCWIAPSFPVPDAGGRYVGVAICANHSYFVRDGGAIDRTCVGQRGASWT